MRTRFPYQGGVAVVTGVSSGIGRAVALDLARRGATVVGLGRRTELVRAAIDDCRRAAPESQALTVDVGDRAAVEASVATVLDRFGRVDVIVNNAGVSMRVHGSRLTAEQVERAMTVNFFGAVYVTLAARPSMLEQGRGHVVNISSVAGRVASPREAAYTASKHALSGWTDAMASDLIGSGVRFHLVHPGPIDTDIWTTLAEPAAYHGRFYPPEDVAAAVRRCLEGGRHEAWVPGWMRMVPVFRALAPMAYVRASGRFDARGSRTGGAAIR